MKGARRILFVGVLATMLLLARPGPSKAQGYDPCQNPVGVRPESCGITRKLHPEGIPYSCRGCAPQMCLRQSDIITCVTPRRRKPAEPLVPCTTGSIQEEGSVRLASDNWGPSLPSDPFLLDRTGLATYVEGINRWVHNHMRFPKGVRWYNPTSFPYFFQIGLKLTIMKCADGSYHVDVPNQIFPWGEHRSGVFAKDGSSVPLTTQLPYQVRVRGTRNTQTYSQTAQDAFSNFTRNAIEALRSLNSYADLSFDNLNLPRPRLLGPTPGIRWSGDMDVSGNWVLERIVMFPYVIKNWDSNNLLPGSIPP